MYQKIMSLTLAGALFFTAMPVAPIQAQESPSEAQVVENPASTPAGCQDKETVQKDFETAINGMFAGIGSKEGVYLSKYDPISRTVKVYILDKTKKATEISGTGLVAGLTKLYEDHHLVKLKIGNQEERNLQAIADKLGNDKTQVQQAFAQIFGTDILNAAQSQGAKTGTLADFIHKQVQMKLTVQAPNCEPVELIYSIYGFEAEASILKDQLQAQDLKVWKGDAVNWKAGLALKNSDPSLQKILDKEETVVTDLAGRKTDTYLPGGAKGSLKVTFADGSALTVDDQMLYVSEHFAGLTDDKAPKDAVQVKFLLGEGVEAGQAPDKKTGDKAQPVEYAAYKVKPGANIETYQHSQLGNSIFSLINPQALKGYENPVWIGKNPADSKDYVVSETNNVFTAQATLAVSKLPTVDRVTVGDKTLSGTGVQGADILVTAGGEEVGRARVDGAGKWRLALPAGKTLKVGDVVKVTQTEADKQPAFAEVIVKAKSSTGTGKTGPSHSSKPGSKPEAKPTPKPETKPETKPEVKPESKLSNHDLNKAGHYSYLTGYPDGTFAPNKGMTRAEVASLFTRLLKDRPIKGQSYKAGLTDVQAGDWYADAVGYAVQKGIVSGYPDGTFKPNQAISRAEFAAIAARFAEMTGQQSPAFSDLASTHWSYQAIRQVAANGWLSGYPDGAFRPDQAITRAEVATISNRMLNRTPDLDRLKAQKDKLPHFSDVGSGDWFYGAIMEASFDRP
ncbi:MAG: S-layer homology domain-containing protein [Clostridiales bacterium]|nr:S-layer homology domain-containing protein [Peptococcus niger]MDU7244223.1 S-layer homology domain-containing protein [Clostridiales bacterium]